MTSGLAAEGAGRGPRHPRGTLQGLGPCRPRGMFPRMPWELAGGLVLSSRVRWSWTWACERPLLRAPKLAGLQPGRAQGEGFMESEYEMNRHGVSGPQGEHPRSSALVLVGSSSHRAGVGWGGVGVRGRPHGAHHAPLPQGLSISHWAKGRGSYSLPVWKGLSLQLLCVYLARSIY